MAPLFTVGHGTLEQEALEALLSGAGVERVVDVRRFPSSRRHPHVNRGELGRWLPEIGIDYRWEEALGGRRSGAADSPHTAISNRGFRAYADHMGTDEFTAALEAALVEAGSQTVAVLCAEAVWWRCHRQFIADAATALHEVGVVHLHHDGRTEPHRVTAAARIAGRRLVYDDAHDQPQLFDSS